MYNYGLQRFLAAKKLSSKEAINAFLVAENVTDFNYKNHNRVNDFIQQHWGKFASFIDKALKTGTIKGEPLKLNTYFDEQRERNNEVHAEFEQANLSEDELRVIKLLKTDHGKVQSFICKKGLSIPAKDYSFTSKQLQNMPIVNLLKKENIIEELLLTIPTYKQGSTHLK